MVMFTLALIAILSAGCSDSHRTSPTAPTPPPTTVAPPPPAFVANVAPPFPEISKPARVYGMTIDGPSAAYHGGTLKARYVLHDDQSFTLQYASPRFGNFEYPGNYTAAGELFYHWSESSLLGATAIITEESLTVSYSLTMQMNDFEDGVFVRVRN
jgi:hypothetical protein